MKRAPTHISHLCVILTALLLSSCPNPKVNPKVAREIGTEIASGVAGGAASAVVTNFFTQSKSKAKPSEQSLISLKPDQSLATEARIAEIKEAVKFVNETEAQAYRNLNSNLLERAYVGEALQLRQALVNGLKEQKVYQIATLHNQQFNDFQISSDGTTAKVEMTEKWSNELYSIDTNTLIGQFPLYEAPQVAYLQKDSNGWRISAISFKSDPPKFVPAQQSPQPTQSPTTVSGWGAVCLKNGTGANIIYSYRWGNNSWKKETLEAGSSSWYSWDYSSGGYPSPKFTVSFDYDMSSNSNFREYDLKKNKVSEKSCKKAKNYSFKYTDNSKNFIDLYSTD
jgi:hypothetical protein